MSKQQAWILIVIAAVAVGALVQINRYEYFEESIGGFPWITRIDRLTGHQCVVSVPVAFRSAPETFDLPKLPLC